MTTSHAHAKLLVLYQFKGLNTLKDYKDDIDTFQKTTISKINEMVTLQSAIKDYQEKLIIKEVKVDNRYTDIKDNYHKQLDDFNDLLLQKENLLQRYLDENDTFKKTTMKETLANLDQYLANYETKLTDTKTLLGELHQLLVKSSNQELIRKLRMLTSQLNNKINAYLKQLTTKQEVKLKTLRLYEERLDNLNTLVKDYLKATNLQTDLNNTIETKINRVILASNSLEVDHYDEDYLESEIAKLEEVEQKAVTVTKTHTLTIIDTPAKPVEPLLDTTETLQINEPKKPSNLDKPTKKEDNKKKKHKFLGLF